jgi:hypothetical protein
MQEEKKEGREEGGESLIGSIYDTPDTRGQRRRREKKT